MPCGDRCKQILDGGAAVKRAINCMTNTTLLKHTGNKGPSSAQAEAFRLAAEEMARVSAEIEASFAD